MKAFYESQIRTSGKRSIWDSTAQRKRFHSEYCPASEYFCGVSGAADGFDEKAGLVKSSRGALGGYRLGREASDISVGEILRVLEGGLQAVDCAGNDGGSCEGADLCVAKYVWKRINDSITQAVDSMMLEQLIEESLNIQKMKQTDGTGGLDL